MRLVICIKKLFENDLNFLNNWKKWNHMHCTNLRNEINILKNWLIVINPDNFTCCDVAFYQYEIGQTNLMRKNQFLQE